MPPSAIMVLSVLLLLIQTASAVPVVTTPWGRIQGVEVAGMGGRKMSGYLGIPFALPPLGDLRFARPQPHPAMPEGETFVADTLPPACIQMKGMLISATQPMSEDCLQLNVYVPTGAENSVEKYPVMFFIHGGGFAIGDASFYKPSKLVADGKVIVVVIQYRLGAFGFISSGDDALPGNQGLWDQNMALRWVHDNIAAFGGDPATVTVFGESAGSMSSTLLMMSPYSKGLMKRVILQSGASNIIAKFAMLLNMKDIFRQVAGLFQCPDEGASTAELLACLRQQPADLYFNKTQEHGRTSAAGQYFYPMLDKDFLPRDLVELLGDADYVRENGIGDIDVLSGFNDQEGALIIMMLIFTGQTAEALTKPEFVGSILDLCINFQAVTPNDVLRKVVEQYYQGAAAGTDTMRKQPLADMYGDCLLTAAIIDWARHLAASPHTARRFLYVMEHRFMYNDAGPYPGSHHGDELALQFDSNIFQDDPDNMYSRLNKTQIHPEEEALSDWFVRLVTTFAKTGDPNPVIQDKLGVEWPEFSVDQEAYLAISDTPRVYDGLGAYGDRAALWLKLVPQLAALTSDTPKAGGGEKEGEAAKKEGEDAKKDEL